MAPTVASSPTSISTTVPADKHPPAASPSLPSQLEPRCVLCQTPMGPRPWAVLCLGDEARPNQLAEGLAEGRLQPLTLCSTCDAALIDFLHSRHIARPS